MIIPFNFPYNYKGDFPTVFPSNLANVNDTTGLRKFDDGGGHIERVLMNALHKRPIDRL